MSLVIHCPDGSVIDIRETEVPAYVFAQIDWMVVEDDDNT